MYCQGQGLQTKPGKECKVLSGGGAILNNSRGFSSVLFEQRPRGSEIHVGV